MAEQPLHPGELADATRQLAVLARLGYPLADGLKNMAKGQRWLQPVAQDVQAGDTLTDAVRRHPNVFSRFYASMVEAAEAAEKPDGILTQLSSWLERADFVRRQVRTALFYPLLVVNGLGLVLALFLSWVLPQAIIPLADMRGDAIPQGLRHLLETGVAGYGVILAIVFLDIVAMQKEKLSQLSSLLPWAGALESLAEQSLWARALGSLLAAGVEVPRALRQAAQVVELPHLRRDLESLVDAVDRGSPLSDALLSFPKLDSSLSWNAAAGERREELAPLMLDAADFIDRLVDRQSAHILRMVEPYALVAVGVLVLAGLLCFWWPYYSLAGSIR